jgi:signal transduction histidine kinase
VLRIVPATMTGDRARGAAADWRPTRRSDTFDAALALMAGAAGAISLLIGGDPAQYGDMADYWRPAGIALTALCVAPLAVRRRLPLLVLAVMTAAYVPLRVLEVPEFNVTPVTLFIALYTAGAYGREHRDLVRGTSVAVIVGLVLWVLATHGDSYEGTVSLTLVNALAALQNVFYLVAAWLLGDLERNRRSREATLERQADELRAAQADEAARAVTDERVRIARELHDVVAHHVSVMGVQAGAARRVLGSRPDEVPALLAAIEGSSRQAVGELAQMLDLLRQADGRNGVTAPQPTLSRLDGLAAQMREAGLDVVVDADVDALDEGLPPALALSVYRIVQEALTNALKHAGRGTTARVTITRHDRAVELVVADDGRGTPVTTPRTATTAARTPTAAPAGPSGGDATGNGSPGHGVVGMQERVALVGGELRVGRRTGGGYEVRAWLPVDDARRAEP